MMEKGCTISSRVLCNYSSSSEEENEPKTEKKPSDIQMINNTASNNKLLKVPTSIQTMYVETENRLNGPPPTSLDVTRHEERVRSFPHTRGNWATTVFIMVRKIKQKQKGIQGSGAENLYRCWNICFKITACIFVLGAKRY